MKPAAALAACLILGACATSRGPAPTPTAQGYLDDTALDQLAGSLLPTPPVPDNEPSDHNNSGPGTDRWWLAIAHAELRPPEAAQHFDCILGTRLAGKPRPALSRIMTRLLTDTESLTRRLAEAHPRQRPIAADPGLQPCQRTNDTSRDSPSWPAGGAVAGAAYGELYANLAPDKASPLRLRGSEIGLSRAVCRMNWMADAQDGIDIGRAVYERAAAMPEFAPDLEAARAEVAGARAEGLTNPGCAAERRALGPGPVRPDAG